MARNPLMILRTVRQREVEQARQALAVCLQAEAEATATVDALSEAAKLDRSASERLTDAFGFLQMFANRLDSLRTQQIAAELSLTTAQTRVSEARSVVAAARTRAEVLEQLVAERNAARAAELERQAQHVMDDIARGGARNPLPEKSTDREIC
jgi:flagellar biosynthesis chaperone FliJ